MDDINFFPKPHNNSIVGTIEEKELKIQFWWATIEEPSLYQTKHYQPNLEGAEIVDANGNRVSFPLTISLPIVECSDRSSDEEW